MKINAGTKMLLFRYKNYKHHEFIKEHMSVLNKNDCVWLLKAGKRTNISKLRSILKEGGWLLLRAPKAEKGVYYLSRFEEISEEKPTDDIYPNYYHEILEADYDEDVFGYEPVYQWFKLVFLKKLNPKYNNAFLLSNTEKNITEIIPTTRTAVMYIKTAKDIIINVDKEEEE